PELPAFPTRRSSDLEGDELAEEHGGAGVVSGVGQALLIGEGDQRRGEGERVHVVAQGGQRRVLGERVGGQQRGGGALGAVPLGERAAALPFRGDGGERVQHGGGQRLRCAVERVVGGAGVGEHVRAEHGAQLTALGRVGEQRGEDLVGVDGGGDGSHTHILGTTKARPACGDVCLRSRRRLITPSPGATGG